MYLISWSYMSTLLFVNFIAGVMEQTVENPDK